MACVYVYVIILTLLGPENLGRKFGVEHDNDMAEVAGKETLKAVVRKDGRVMHRNSSDVDEHVTQKV